MTFKEYRHLIIATCPDSGLNRMVIEDVEELRNPIKLVEEVALYIFTYEIGGAIAEETRHQMKRLAEFGLVDFVKEN